MTKKKKFTINAFLLLTAILSFLGMNGQGICGGAAFPPSYQQQLPDCGASSTAYSTKYGKQAFYVPTTNDPVITVKITFHVFNKVDGTGLWPNSPSTISQTLADFATLSSYFGGYDRYSDPRNASYFVSGFSSTNNYDSRVRYEVTNVYFYNDNTLNLLTAYQGSPLFTAIAAAPGNRLEEGIPIIITSASPLPLNAAGFMDYNNGLPFIQTAIVPTSIHTIWYAYEHLRHEIGHAMGWYHTYGGSSGDELPTYGCLHPYFLSDVFPQNNPMCPTGTHPCDVCPEGGANSSNNVMSGAPGNNWISHLQQGRRIRTMHLMPVRVYAKDAVSDHINPWNITSNETWDFDIQMYRDIVVKQGNTLTIKCKVAMAIDGKIKVEKGAKLLIDKGEVTGWCKTGLWKGIEVDGSSSQNQNVSGGYGVYQGYVNVINNAIISNAQNAICTYTTDANGNMDANSTGGIVICNTANFINNVRSAEFYYYYSPTGGNLGSFTKCNFNTTGALKAGALPSHHVTMYNVDGVKFLGCNFEYSAGGAYATMARGNGIYSIDATYFVNQYSTTKTTFKNLVNGIYADNSNPLRVVSVTNTEFYDNIYNSAYFNTMTTPVFTDNYVRTASAGFGACGLYLNNCKYYNVKNNTFLESSAGFANDVGIYVHNSQTGLHKIYRNSFANFQVGINAQNNNSGATNTTDGLKMNCNDFTPSQNLYDIALTGTIAPSVMKTQGAIVGMTGLNVVRNRYGAASTCGTCENKWYISSGSKVVDHGANSDANTRPTPQPQNSDVLVNVVNSGFPWSAANCPPTESDGGGGGSGRLANINEYISNLTIENALAKGTNPNAVSENLKPAIYEKLNYFLLDSLASSKDSVIALLQNNPAGMDDADVLLTYAYINKGDFVNAQQNANNLNNKNDWKSLQLALIDIHQSALKEKILKSNAAAKSFLENYTSADKSGLGAAQSMLKFATGKDYFIPHLLPYIENGINKSINTASFDESVNSEFYIYPNPAAEQVNFIYRNKDENYVHVSLTNTLGKIVYENDVKANTKMQIALDNFAPGVYILTAIKGKEQVYQTKVICTK